MSCNKVTTPVRVAGHSFRVSPRIVASLEICWNFKTIDVKHRPEFCVNTCCRKCSQEHATNDHLSLTKHSNFVFVERHICVMAAKTMHTRKHWNVTREFTMKTTWLKENQMSSSFSRSKFMKHSWQLPTSQMAQVFMDSKHGLKSSTEFKHNFLTIHSKSRRAQMKSPSVGTNGRMNPLHCSCLDWKPRVLWYSSISLLTKPCSKGFLGIDF